jgi:hypothetical protein
VADRFVVANGTGADSEGALLALDGTKTSAGGAGLLSAEAVRLLFQESAEGAFGQASGSGASNLLHRVEIDLGARAFLTEGVTGNYFAPALGQLTDFLKVFR